MTTVASLSKSLALATIVSALTACNAPDQSSKPETVAPTTSESQPIVTIDIQNALHRPVILSEANLRYVHDKVDELAAASKLAKLTSESEDEIRIWATVATFGSAPGYDTVGYIITPPRMSRCEIDYPANGQPPFAGKCEVMPRDTRDFDAARFMEPLLHYADTDMGCGVLDGVWYELDIVHGGKRFVIGASNPNQCNDPGSTAVSALLEVVYR